MNYFATATSPLRIQQSLKVRRNKKTLAPVLTYSLVLVQELNFVDFMLPE